MNCFDQKISIQFQKSYLYTDIVYERILSAGVHKTFLQFCCCQIAISWCPDGLTGKMTVSGIDHRSWFDDFSQGLHLDFLMLFSCIFSHRDILFIIFIIFRGFKNNVNTWVSGILFQLLVRFTPTFGTVYSNFWYGFLIVDNSKKQVYSNIKLTMLE